MPVTLQRVADQAGVSLATASRVLHGSGGRTVRAALADRVMAAARDLRYVSHGPAQALARATSPVIGLIVHDITDPYFASIASGAMRAAHASGHLVMVASTFRDPELELAYVDQLRTQRVRGIVLAGSAFTSRSYAARLAEHLGGYPQAGGRAVTIGGHGADIDAVLPDNRAGGRLAAEHLIERGHVRIGVIAGPAGLSVVADRTRGLTTGLTKAGIRPIGTEVGSFDRESGRAAMARLLADRPDITAVFAHNDRMALGALAHLRDAGRLVPKEVAVIGFDDLPGSADLTPALTTIRLDLEALGAAAIDRALAPPDAPVHVERRPVTLVVRETT
jgi:LacI family transcriptional regulator